MQLKLTTNSHHGHCHEVKVIFTMITLKAKLIFIRAMTLKVLFNISAVKVMFLIIRAMKESSAGYSWAYLIYRVPPRITLAWLFTRLLTQEAIHPQGFPDWLCPISPSTNRSGSASVFS